MSDKTNVLYDLKTGYPHMGVIPRALLHDLTPKLLDMDVTLQYFGTENGPRHLRQQIATMLSEQVGREVPASELHLTAGAIHGVDSISRYVCKPGDVVLVENPTFYYMIHKFELNHVDVLGVPMQTDGVDVDALEALCQQYGERVAMFYAIPSYHNPTGHCYTAEKRRTLVELAKRYNFKIVEDSIYQTVYFDEPPPPMIREFDEEGGHVLTAGSFSKLVTPAIRTGWIWSTEQQTRDLRAYNVSVNSAFMGYMAADMIESGEMAKQLDYARQFYGDKHDIFTDTMAAHAPDWLEWSAPNGGYFVWCTLPEGLAATDVHAAAKQQGVDFMPGRLAFVNEDAPDRYMRLCFAMQEDDVLVRGVEVLCDVLKSMPVSA